MTGIRALNKSEEDAYSQLLGAMYRVGVLKNEKGDEIMATITDRFGKKSPIGKKR